MEEMELELGSLLKKTREEKKLSLDDIQEETKIRKKYLEAIEENNFEILPGKVYLKVFIKGYAREVGLDYQELVEKYEVLNIKEKKESNLQKDYLNGTKVTSSSQKNNDRKSPLKIIFILLLILFLGAAAVYTYQYINNSELRLLNQQSSQSENIEEDSELLEVEEEQSPETVSENEEDETNSEASDTDLASDISELDLNSSDSDNNNLLDSFDSGLLTEENTEIIDQNNFDEPEGLDSTEQNQISEIIISEDFQNQQENTEEENLQEERLTAEEEEESAQTNNVQENNQSEEDLSLEAVNSANNEEPPADETETQQESVLDNNIVILASDTVWITIDVDGNNAFSGILEAGDQQQFEIEDRLYIKIGNGNAITAEIAGENYGPWAGNGEIAEVEFLNDGEEITINNLRE